MIETLAMIAAGYAGYAGWPWWWAAILGAAAGIWNAGRRFFISPWTTHERAWYVLVYVCVWTGTLAALLFTGIYFAVHWITAWLS